VISVVLGDYHFGALTSTGKFLTWGAYSSGALGLGDPTKVPVGKPGGYESDDRRERAKRFRIIPPEVTEPTEVKFGTRDGGKGHESFVFSATASGWHTGALVIDLEVRDAFFAACLAGLTFWLGSRGRSRRGNGGPGLRCP
jgi:SCF-associated factor 1